MTEKKPIEIEGVDAGVVEQFRKIEELAALDLWLRQHCAHYKGVIVLDGRGDQWDLVAWTERTLKKIGE
jgi:hypothetical protein